MSGAREEHGPGRTAEKRQTILSTATELFLRNGFRGTSMDELASQAGVSKQTVYKQFTDKERLFREIIEGVTANAQAVISALTAAFGDTPATTRDELEARLCTVARVYLDAVLSTQVLSLRRLIIAETEQFPISPAILRASAGRRYRRHQGQPRTVRRRGTSRCA